MSDAFNGAISRTYEFSRPSYPISLMSHLPLAEWLSGEPISWLDLGSGTGSVADFALGTGTHVTTSVEPDGGMRKILNTRFPEIDIVATTAQRYNELTEKHSFNVVSVGQALHYVGARTAWEIACKSNGDAVLLVLNNQAVRSAWFSEIGQMLVDGDHIGSENTVHRAIFDLHEIAGIPTFQRDELHVKEYSRELAIQFVESLSPVQNMAPIDRDTFLAAASDIFQQFHGDSSSGESITFRAELQAWKI